MPKIEKHCEDEKELQFVFWIKHKIMEIVCISLVPSQLIRLVWSARSAARLTLS